ncbi:hypothetical protein [Pseudomonas aeruginosa]|uniref:hypothetical protein n=1 Tax=Pseudomonas aeruginosa TaxID=287 RepID=UPI0012987A5E|nr:hypothetical protein [Pseudomonas aeruginosa]MBO0969398.1 hypothetical protein [Pseudomonas aeruginosa]MDV6778937.1 hypothetical protein [Pseudomonas aeruginosa]MDY1054376.1 hypothetical protein [Pseudomonas aeruginosa]HBO0429659.1 hypothetical protein [Pseudomonas aeruginosa]
MTTQASKTFTVIEGHIQYAPPENVEQAYVIVLDVANRVLRQCRLFSIESLKEENPTIGEIARRLRVICALMHDLNEIDGFRDVWTVEKAEEYTSHVQALADAIDANDVLELDRQCELLNGRSFL